MALLEIHRTCELCNGVGEVHPHGESTTTTCPACGGSGKMPFAESVLLDERLQAIEDKIDVLTTLPVNIFYSYKIWEATNLTEFMALSDANKDSYRGLVRMGTIDLNEGSHSRNTLWTLFGSETTTRANLLALLE